MNSFLNELQYENRLKNTENGAIALDSLLNKVYQLFALGGAYRNRDEIDQIKLFDNAFGQNPELTLKCLFWIRDCRGGAGERQFFKRCIRRLAFSEPEIVKANLKEIVKYGRWDDLYALVDTPVEKDVFKLMGAQLVEDMANLNCEDEKVPVSLLGKWMKSCNSHSAETRRLGHLTRHYLNLSEKEYRQMLTKLRARIGIIETYICQKQYDKIDFSKVPSKASLIYSDLFRENPELKDRYMTFIKNKDTKIHADVLYPSDLVEKVYTSGRFEDADAAINKMWDALPDYMEGKNNKILCICDNSGSMTCGKGKTKPIYVSIGLSVYCAQRLSGDFHNSIVTFASNPKYFYFEDNMSFVDIVRTIRMNTINDSTDLMKTFDLLMSSYLNSKEEDRPDTLVIISDMEINFCQRYNSKVKTIMEQCRKEWADAGLKFPKVVYWNVNARKDTFLEDDTLGVSLVSGYSPALFKQILTGKAGIELMLETLAKYEDVNLPLK